MRPTNIQFSGQQNQFEDFGLIPSVGGQIIQMQAGGNLNVGDVVQVTGTGIVNKAITNPSKVIGVVVGGGSMPDNGIFETAGANSTTDIAIITAGLLAAINGQVVYVLCFGVFYVVADGAIPNGSGLKQSGATAGRVTAATSALTIAAGGTAVTSTAANGAIISGDTSASTVFGTLIDAAAAGNGDVRLAFINV